MKAVKDLYERRQEKKIGSQDVSNILSLFLGSTTILWVRKLFLNKNEMGASPRQGVKMCCRFWADMSIISVVVVKSTIWCLSCGFDESIIWCFQSWVFGKRRLLQVERLTKASSNDGHMVPSTSSKNYFGVVTPLVTVERERDSFSERVLF